VTSPRKLLILLLLVALIIRLAWVLSRPAELAADLPDQTEYLSVAQNLVQGRGMVFHDPRFDADVYAFRAPGYPLLMALCGANVRAIRMIQALLDTSVVLAVYLLARRLLVSGERSEQSYLPLVAGVLVAFNPYLIYFSGLILSETLFTALLAWGLVLAVMKRRPAPPAPIAPPPPPAPRPSVIPMARRDVPEPPKPPPPKPRAPRRPLPYALFGGAILLALAVLVRPGAMVLPAILLALAGWATRQRWFSRLIVGAAVTFVVLLPWAYRNHRLLYVWVWTTTNAGHTAYDGFGPTATGASDLSDLRNWPDLRKLGEVGRDRLLGETAREWIQRDPIRAARLAVAKIARTWSPVPLSEGYGTRRNVLIGLGYSVPLFGLTLIGLVGGAMSVRAKALCLAPAIYFTAVVTVSVGSLRYRIPAEPPMAVIAAGAIRWVKLKGEGEWRKVR
jgi:hypothetical protein